MIVLSNQLEVFETIKASSDKKLKAIIQLCEAELRRRHASL